MPRYLTDNHYLIRLFHKVDFLTTSSIESKTILNNKNTFTLNIKILNAAKHLIG